MSSVEVIPDRYVVDTWRVEWFIDEREGTMGCAVFSGQDAEERAREYAVWRMEEDDDR